MKDFAKSIVCNTKAGNYTPNYRYKGFLITNPEGYEFVVFLQDGIHVGYRGTTSKAQAEDWCDWHDPKTGKPVAKFRNSKTGNSKTGNGVWYGEAWNGDKFCYYKDKDDNTAEVSKKVDKNGNASWIVTFRSGKSSGYYGRLIGEYSDFKKAKKVAEDKVHAAKTGNGVFSIFKSDKPIKMKSPQGAIVTINPDGTAAHQDKEGSQMAVHPHNSFKEAVEYYKSQGYVKVGNVGERWYSVSGIKSNPAKYKMGQSVKVNGEKGKITQIQAMKMSSTPTYKIKLNSGEEVWAYEEEIGNTKTGNESLGEYMAKKPRVINEEKTGAEEFFKQLSDDVKEREKKDDADIEKVGNREVYVNQYERTKAVVYEDGTIMLWDKNGNNYKTIKAGSLEEARKKLNSDYKKVGNANLETSVEKGKLGLWNWYVHKDGTIVAGGTSSTETNAKEMARKALEKEKAGNKVGNAAATFFIIAPNGEKVKAIDYDQWHYKCVDTGELVEKRFSKRIGNSIGGGVQSETVLTEAKDGSQYWVEKTSKSGQYAQYNLYYTIGQGKRHAGVFKDKEAAADAGRRIIGNKKLKFTDKKDGKIEYVYDEESKDGHIYYDGKLVDTKKAVGPGWVDLIKQKAFSSGVMNKTGNAFTSSDKKRLDELARKKPTQLTPQEWKEFQDLNKREEEASREMLKKSGNSASDDKFAYVMREFDEGKLKTPDGKVVTDPAQAKAIAYSESKKTENGLARARKAMNKGITMWKGNDSAYIKEDGTVSYLENNSFETDKDKFESQEYAIKELSKQGYVKK